MAEIKSSKVVSVQSNGTWEGSYGTMYKFEIVFQNGDVGEYSSKSQDQNKFEVGAEKEYEYTGGKFPKVKPVYQQKSSGFGGAKSFGGNDDKRQQMIIAQSSLKASVDFHSINPELKPTEQDVLKTAQRFIDFVNGNESLQFSKDFIPVSEAPSYSSEDGKRKTSEENLPF